MQMSLGILDGNSVYAFRYASKGTPRSLFHSKSVDALKQLNSEFERFSSDARAVVSEPLTDLSDYWVEIPDSSAVVIRDGEIDCVDFEPVAP